MKYVILSIGIISLFCYFNWHKKHEELNNHTLSLLQGKWKIDSIIFFPSGSFLGQGRKMEDISAEQEYRNDFKRYTETRIPGENIAHHDTA